MLNNFFRINMPYGITRNEKGEWSAFNREYMPLGYNDSRLKGNIIKEFGELPIWTKYKALHEKTLLLLAYILKPLKETRMGKSIRFGFTTMEQTLLRQKRKNNRMPILRR